MDKRINLSLYREKEGVLTKLAIWKENEERQKTCVLMKKESE